MRYRLTTRGKIVVVVLGMLLIASGISLFNPEDSIVNEMIAETSSEVIVGEPSSKQAIQNEDNSIDDLVLQKEIVADSKNTDLEIKEMKEAGKRIYFKPDKYDLASSESKKIDGFIEIAMELPQNEIIVEGNINGYPEYNDTEFGVTLSNKRAEVIRDYLIENGVSKERIIVFSLGSKKTIENTSSVTECWKNRRTDIYFKDYNNLEY